mmetsp:Transcript_81922/g.132891  ORF Transcript_81922/g.132891 Transcript_81922/m.132891 type:complete len:201 (-) Transcript_81922:229-831(-)
MRLRSRRAAGQAIAMRAVRRQRGDVIGAPTAPNQNVSARSRRNEVQGGCRQCRVSLGDFCAREPGERLAPRRLRWPGIAERAMGVCRRCTRRRRFSLTRSCQDAERQRGGTVSRIWRPSTSRLSRICTGVWWQRKHESTVRTTPIRLSGRTSETTPIFRVCWAMTTRPRLMMTSQRHRCTRSWKPGRTTITSRYIIILAP